MFGYKAGQMHAIRGHKNIGTEISFTLHSPLFFRSPLQRFHSPWGEPFTRLRSNVPRKLSHYWNLKWTMKFSLYHLDQIMKFVILAYYMQHIYFI